MEPRQGRYGGMAHIDNFRKAVPGITSVEFLSETRSGVGTRFRETRVMNGREATVELEVTEFVENDLDAVKAYCESPPG